MMDAQIKTFHTIEADAAGILSWVHIGDLHMTLENEQNHLDLQAIVEEINRVFKSSIGFVFLPGDVAEKGDEAAYRIVRNVLDDLQVPCCSIIGDHDVHEKSFHNFLQSMWPEKHYSFQSPDILFLALNAFDMPHPGSFAIQPEQMQWLSTQLEDATSKGLEKVLLLHCYPSDLKTGAEQLQELMARHNVLLVEMGHTHYNEVANDGRTLYLATRSTGQIEEGPVGFSITNIDGDAVSWRFIELNTLPAVIITSPGDERLTRELQNNRHAEAGGLRVRAKVWNDAPIATVRANCGQDKKESVAMQRIDESNVWQATLPASASAGVSNITVTVTDMNGRVAEDAIRIAPAGKGVQHQRHTRDQDNEIGAWPEHGLLGTQLGPNKNGRKW